MITLRFSKKNRSLLAAAVVAGVVTMPPIAKALDIGALFSAGSSLFQSLSSGDFNLGSIFNIANDVSSISGNLGGPSLGNFSSSLGNLSSSGASDYSYGSGSFLGGGGFDPSETLEGDYTTTEGGFMGGGSGGGFGLNQDTFEKVARSSDYIQGLYGSIQQGNLGGSVNNILGILGAFGILDPNDVSSQQGSSGAVLGDPSRTEVSSLDDEIRNAKYPIDVYYAGQKRQNIFRTSDHDLSQIVLGKPGQKLIAGQAKEQALAIAVSEQGSAAVAKYVGNAAQLNTSQEKAVKSAEKAVQAGVKTKQTLDAIHALIAVSGIHSGQLALLSGGQTLNTAALAQLSKQMNASVAVNKINGDVLRTISVQTAATNHGISLMSGDIDAMRRHTLDQEASQMSFVTQSQSLFRVPGLFGGSANGSQP